jgi:hypothetical protein
MRQDHLRQQQQQQAAFQAQQQWEAQYAQITCDAQLAAVIQGLGYSQSNPDPEEIRLALENRTLLQRLHQMKQMMAALRQQNLPAPAPAPPYYGGHTTPPPAHFVPPPTHNALDGGPLAHTNDFATSAGLKEWKMKQELKKHQVPLFDGKLDLDGLLKWQQSVEYYARLAGMNETSLISTAWQNFTPDVLDWFTHFLRTQYNMDSFPPQYYLFSWAELKCKMEATYASTFATKHVWCDLETLKCGSNLSEFHSPFLDVAKLERETAHTAVFGSRLYNIYTAKMSDSKRQILSLVIVTADQTGCTTHLCSAMNVVDVLNLL